jgi:hypothetical protein
MERRLDALLRILEVKMSALSDAVAGLQAEDQAVIDLLNALAAQVAQAADVPAAVDAINAEVARLQAAAAADTPPAA